MDFEKGMLFSPDRKRDPMESGYSETQQSHDIETKFDTKNVNNKKRKPLQQVSRQVKILEAFQQVNIRLNLAVTSLTQVSHESTRQQEKILDEIRFLKNLQDELLQCLLLDQRGSLTKEATSKEAWNLIE